jgi:hypothetical protein
VDAVAQMTRLVHRVVNPVFFGAGGAQDGAQSDVDRRSRQA